MGLVPVEGCHLVEFAKFSVDPDLGITPLAHLLQKLLIMAFAALDYRSQKITFAVLVVFHDQRHYLFVGITDHGLAGMGRVCSRSPCIQEAEEVVDFSYGSDGRTGVVSGGLLLDGNYRTETGNRLYLRFFQYTHEMLGIGRKRVHVPPLALGVDGIEGKG